MRNLIRFISVMIMVGLLAACARFDATGPSSIGTPQTGDNAAQLASTKPSEEFQKQEILTFLPSDVATTLSEKEKSEAASAQFFALQYGRVGAFREWNADGAAKGEVSVGPYVKVNQLDCREFTHTVIVSGTRHSKSGTSCREKNGQWRVVG